MKPMRTSLYWRLLVWFCVANLLVLALGGLFARRFIEFTTSIEINWAALAQDADQAYESGGRDALAAWVAQQRQQGVEATLFEHGEMLYPIRLGASVRSQLPALLSSDRSVVMQPRPSFYVAVQQVVGDDGHARQLLAMSRSHVRLRPQTREKIYLAMQLALSLLFIGLVGWWVARSVARPVEALRRATRRMAEGELSARVGRQGGLAHDELAQLAGDFDVMAGRIEALVAQDRGVLQDLSHELRSPLARLQLILDLARRGGDSEEGAAYFVQAEQEIARLDRMLGEMLALSRMEGGLPGMEREPLELAEVVHEGVEQSRLEADAQQVELQLSRVDSAQVSGNAMLLERALANLLANAIKFSPAGGRVEVTLRVDSSFAEISVRDHGPGVPVDELALLFRPFFRGSNAARAEGHGLGLAIVQRVVQVHGGTIEVGNAEGGGLEVRLRLPLA
ncbi:histidine kinase [Rhodanobacter sp. Root179]|uniref:sensor histidine kinase n=1 Tax=Rhodanobacter sp. Root179 TaxID=1736482 RepID=UPI0006F9CD1A|nr:HAMP domain-containing sensor histidine kinase [Rhodanobacter sp. Root179]KRB60364.1 histidine kinase [Rhodanobacter sp. Root179]